ncbi:MAG TPA: enoyl-CoA hydratase-related protein [Candidatus Eisenbacteria bacterium]|nr:enoyl-CoA hydratase-related protein [Candidatus Eisenbacteria bacterium]
MTIQTGLADGIATLTLDHPPLNVLTLALVRELRRSLAGLAQEPELRAVLIAAEGKHFSAGADVGEHLPPVYREMIPEFVQTLEALASFPVPVIAAVRGRCLGGGFELAQCADVIVAGESASFGQPEIVLGVTAPVACALLPRRGGPGAAAELLFGGDAIPARRAADLGLVQRVVPDEQVESEARALAQRFARHSAAALRATKKTLLAAADGPRADALRAAQDIYLEELMETEDALEGLHSFVEKRSPSWRHR